MTRRGAGDSVSALEVPIRKAANDVRHRRGEAGSALVIAMLISVILALLGISFLMIAETESKLAQNEKRAAQTLYVAEAGLRVVKRWFDGTDNSPGFPAPSVVDRTLRRDRWQ